MAIEPTELLDYSKTHLNDSKEIYLRSAASKAYYYAFHHTADLALNLPEAPYKKGRSGVHDEHIRRFTEYEPDGGDYGRFRREIKALGYILQHMKSIRIIADYRLNENFPQSKTAEAVEYAEKVAGRLAIIQP